MIAAVAHPARGNVRDHHDPRAAREDQDMGIGSDA